MSEKEYRFYEFKIEVNPDEKENFSRFCFECFRLAVTSFPSISSKMLRGEGFVVCPRDDFVRPLSPE